MELMSDQPLKPFSLPKSLLEHLNGTVSMGTLVPWMLSTVFALWAVYTLVVIYHWVKYSHASWVAFPAIGIHLFVSFLLIAYALSGAFFAV